MAKPSTKSAPPVERAAGSPPRIRSVPAVDRAVAILRLLAKSSAPLNLTAVAQELKLVPSTCLHLLRTLVREELVEYDAAAKKYRLGLGLVALARSALARDLVSGAVQPSLDKLSARWEVTAMAVRVAEPKRMTVLALSRSPAPFSLHVDIGSRFPRLVSASGRLVAAFSNEPRAVIEQQFKQLRWDRPITLAAWRKDVAIAKKQRYSVDRGSYISGVTLVAVPLFAQDGRLTHTVVCAGMSGQLSAGRINELVRQMQEEVAVVERRLAN